MITMSGLAEAIDGINDRLLEVEAQSAVSTQTVRKMLVIALANNEGLKAAWKEGIEADRARWVEGLDAAKDEPTRKYMAAGVAAIDALEREFKDI